MRHLLATILIETILVIEMILVMEITLPKSIKMTANIETAKSCLQDGNDVDRECLRRKSENNLRLHERAMC